MVHEWIVSLFYAEDIEPPFIFHTSPEDVDQIINMLDSLKQLKLLDLTEKSRRSMPDWELKNNKELYEKMNINQTWFEIKKMLLMTTFSKKWNLF